MALSVEAAREMGRALGMNDSDIDGYKAQFDACDEDGGGTISNDELKTVLVKCGVKVTMVEVNRYIKEFDTDGDGVLDFGEFITMMHKFNQGPSESDTRKAMFEVRGLTVFLEPLGGAGGQMALHAPSSRCTCTVRSHAHARACRPSVAPFPLPPHTLTHPFPPN